MSKYYTPEIEEFYVGFEYYTTTHPVSMEEFSPYVKGEFDHNTFEREFNIDTDSSGEIIKIGVPSCIKVKYLDREDIESLGFFCHATDERVFHNKNGIIINTEWGSPVKEGITLAVVSPVFDESKMNIIHEHYLFNGTIKNKSELKKLLKQLGI